jgi:hypothetical protein
MSNDPPRDDDFTPEEQERIQAHIKARGMTFEVFLPESLANWLRAKLAEGVFSDAKGSGLRCVSGSAGPG